MNNSLQEQLAVELAMQKRSLRQWCNDILRETKMLGAVALKIIRDMLEVKNYILYIINLNL